METNRKQALEELCEKVSKGEVVSAHDASRIWPNGYAHAINAGGGSLDAAKALHEAVLPTCNQFIVDQDPSGCGAHVVVWPNGLTGKQLDYKGYAETPARAWLIAILSALIAQEGE